MHWERLGEAIQVRVDFAAGTAVPRLFRLGGRLHRVQRVNSDWTERDGQRLLRLFSVTTEDGDVYQLCFDSGQLLWRADAVMYEG